MFRIFSKGTGATGTNESAELRKKLDHLGIRDRDLRKYELASVIMPDTNLKEFANILDSSASQLGQDIFALAALGFKNGLSFVEFGAADGLSHSNSLLLERRYHWSGALAEPNSDFFLKLEENRPNCYVSDRAIFSVSGSEVSFSNAHLLSTITQFVNSDRHVRRIKEVSKVVTQSFEDFLQDAGFDNYVDFVSIDTEGSELQILDNFDFSTFQFGAMCIEHNYTDAQKGLSSLLEKNGYVPVLKKFSRQDIWAVPKGHPFATLYSE